MIFKNFITNFKDFKEEFFFTLTDSCSKNDFFFSDNFSYCNFLYFLRFFENWFTLELNFWIDWVLRWVDFLRFLWLFLGNFVFYFLLFFLIFWIKIFLEKIFKINFSKYFNNFFEKNLIIFWIFLNIIPKIWFLSIFFIAFSKINFRKKILFLIYSIILNYFISFTFYLEFFFDNEKKWLFVEKTNFYDYFSHFTFWLSFFIIFSFIYKIFTKK